MHTFRLGPASKEAAAGILVVILICCMHAGVGGTGGVQAAARAARCFEEGRGCQAAGRQCTPGGHG